MAVEERERSVGGYISHAVIPAGPETIGIQVDTSMVWAMSIDWSNSLCEEDLLRVHRSAKAYDSNKWKLILFPISGIIAQALESGNACRYFFFYQEREITDLSFPGNYNRLLKSVRQLLKHVQFLGETDKRQKSIPALPGTNRRKQLPNL